MTRRQSVRFRITLLAVAVLAIVLTAAGAALLVVLRTQLTDNLDTSLSRRADDVTELVSAGLPLEDEPRVLASEAGEDAVVQVVRADDGTVVAATANAVELDPIAAAPPEREVVRTFDQLPIEDDAYRVLSRNLSGDAAGLVLHVAENTDDTDDVNRALLIALVLIVPAAVAVLSALVWILVGRALRPVEELRAEVAEIRGPDLHRRLHEPATGDEIERLASTMNAMLDRLEDSSERQQRFVADASHELRSPLTRIRTELEVDLADPDRADLVATHESVLAEATELGELLDGLLLLARSGPDAPRRSEALDLDDVVFAEIARLGEVDAGNGERAPHIDVSLVEAAAVRGDRGQLVRVVRNLLDNATRHASGQVSVTLAVDDGRAILSVADDGPGVAVDEVDRIFDRFTRLDAARSRRHGGAGLGLAIVREIVDRHGGRVWLDAAHRPGARFVVELPADAAVH